MKRLICLFVLLFTIGGQVMAAGPAPCFFQRLWTQCMTPNIYLGTNGATFGAVTNPSNIYIGTGLYRDASGSALASATQTGWAQVSMSRVTTATAVALDIKTDYQDAQTIDTSIISTNAKIALDILGNGTVLLNQGLQVGGNTTSDSNLGTISSVTLGNYYKGSFTLTFDGVGFAASQAITVQYTKIGTLVTLEFGAKTATGASGGAVSAYIATTASLPSALAPQATMDLTSVLTIDAGVNQVGLIDVNSSGLIRIYKNASTTGTFSSGSTIGWNRFSISYITAT